MVSLERLHQRLLSVTPDMVVVPTDAQAGCSRNGWGAEMLPDVVAAHPFANGTALLRSGNRSRGVEVAGVLASGLRDVIDLPPHMINGDVEVLETMPFAVVLGADLARLLRVHVGDEVDMLLPRLTVSPMGVFLEYDLFVWSAFLRWERHPMRASFMRQVRNAKLFG